MKVGRVRLGGTVPVRKAITVAQVLRRLAEEGWVLPPGVTAQDLAALSQTTQDLQRVLAQLAAHPLEPALRSYLENRSFRAIPEGQLADILQGSDDLDTAATAAWRALPPSKVTGLMLHAMASNAQRAGQVLLAGWERSASMLQWIKDGGGDFGMLQARFGAVNPMNVPALARVASRAFQNIEDSTYRGIRRALREAMSAGQNPLATARELRALSGFALTDVQYLALQNYRKALQAGDWEGAQSRALHPPKAVPPQTSAQVDALTERYADRLALARAQTIARTEQMRAANTGTQAAWETLQEQGAFPDAEIRRFWVTAPEDASFAGVGTPPGERSKSGRALSGPCDLCASVPEMNPDGRALDEPFETPDGELDLPPLHPNCRCLVWVRPIFAPVEV